MYFLVFLCQPPRTRYLISCFFSDIFFHSLLFLPVRTLQIPIAFRPNSSFTPHQLSIHYRLEGIHYHQHSETHPLVHFFPNTNHPNHIKSTSSFFFPILTPIWRTYIEFLSHYFTDPLAIVYPGSGPSQLDDLSR